MFLSSCTCLLCSLIKDYPSSYLIYFRYDSRRSGSRETSYWDHSSSGRRQDEDDYVRRRAVQLRCRSDEKVPCKSFDEDIHEDSMDLKDNRHKKRKIPRTDADGELFDDDKEISGDEFNDHARESSRWQSRDNKTNSHEYASDRDWLTRERERERHHDHTRKSTKYRRKVRKLDDYCDYKSHEVDGDRRERGGDRETYHGIRKNSSGQCRKAGYSGDRGDSKSRSSDTDGEWSAKDSRGDELLDKHEVRHHRQIRRQLNEVLDILDDQREPAKSLEDRGDHSRRENRKPDSCNENLSSDKRHDSRSSRQHDERYRSHDLDLRYSSVVQMDKQDHGASEQCSYKSSHKSRRSAASSRSPGRYNGSKRSYDYDSGLY